MRQLRARYLFFISPFIVLVLSGFMSRTLSAQDLSISLEPQNFTQEQLLFRMKNSFEEAGFVSPTTGFVSPTNRVLPSLTYDMIQEAERRSSSGVFSTMQTQSGVAFITSALLPGSAQLANGKTGRGILYLAIEAGAIAIHADQLSKARQKEREYEAYANSNWSVVKYARWLVGYHDFHNLSNSRLEELRNLVRNVNPLFSIDVDWQAIPISLLRDVERNTLYVYGTQRGSNNFSHVMPDYGSQQYYELISKYYQYGPGWKDFPETKFVLPWNGSEMSDQFYLGRDRAEAFNDHYRLASNMVSVLILNHVFSAFDAYFTVNLKKLRIQAQPPASAAESLRFTLEF